MDVRKMVSLFSYGMLAFATLLVIGMLGTIGCRLVSAPDWPSFVIGAFLLACIPAAALAAIASSRHVRRLVAAGAAKFGALGALLLVIASSSGCWGYETIEPGHVGIKVNLYGSDKGVEAAPLLTGRVWYSTWNERVYVFPTYMQTAIWSASAHEGAPHDESISFNSVEGTSINVDVSIAYAFEADKVPHVVQEFRRDAQAILDTYVRNRVRDAFSETAGKMHVMDIFGEKKQELLTSVLAALQAELGPKGIKFDSVSIVGNLRVDQKVHDSINAVITAKQRAVEAEAKVAQAKAEADQAVATALGAANSAREAAKGSADAVKFAAEAEAEAIRVKAKAQAEANESLSRSLTPALVQWQIGLRWKGDVPTYTGSGAVPFVNVR